MTKGQIKSALKKKGAFNLENIFILNLYWEFFKHEDVSANDLLESLNLNPDDIKAYDLDATKKEADKILADAKQEAKEMIDNLNKDKEELKELREKAIKALNNEK